ncbi:hypothetical protein KSF_078200 [Reticulibacter mediterranei]|uniref:Uncharacterized protein n=1 Tax=Reticulibacter mediterranei TaxID=2778369 RepID=A0A8J3N812_9CHLR|nr:hypothetical protein KSF_078200 [Reticulibacter mediterranei]
MAGIVDETIARKPCYVPRATPGNKAHEVWYFKGDRKEMNYFCDSQEYVERI